MKELLLLERAVLESVAGGNNSLVEVAIDCQLDESITRTILSRLIKRGLICFDGTYKILKNDIAYVNINRTEARQAEVNELVETLVNSYFDQSGTLLKVQKVALNAKEEKIFNSLLNSLEIFIRDIQKEKRKVKTSDQKVVLWGATNYGELISSTLVS
jgi:predicted transcriptional regulator